MITGRNPGKHGLFDFIAHKKNSYGVDYLFGYQRRCPTIWKNLSDMGYRVGVLNVPMTYPPEPVNGYMISGLDAPDENSDFIYPKALKKEILGNFGRFRLDIRHLGYMDNDAKRSAVLEELVEIEHERFRLIEYLHEHHPVDAMMFVINAVDQVQHHFWHYMDEGHPRFDRRGDNPFHNAILNVYKEIDGIIAKTIALFGEQTKFILVSDHGFQSSSNTMVCLNKALEEGRLLSFRKGTSPLLYATEKIDGFLRNLLPPRAKQRIMALMPGARSRIDSLAAVSLIDWSKTRAYSLEVMVTSPNVWINLKGKRPQGIVDPADYRSVLLDVKACLYDLKNPVTGSPVISRIAEKEEIFSGPALEDAPDLIPFWWDSPGFTPRPSILNGAIAPYSIVENISDPIKNGSEWGGTHSAEGIVLISGPDIQPGKLDKASITDIAPTLYDILLAGHDADFDGRSLLSPSNVQQPLARKGEEQVANQVLEEIEISEQDQEKVRQRLKMLGYL
jgi:predicted AlkP superfamily phosphohydrolase/phosphomutase